MRRHLAVFSVAAGFLVLTAVLVAVDAEAQKPPKTQAQLTLAATPAQVTFGKPVTFSGKLTGAKAVAGETVALQADVAPFDGAYADVATAVTDTGGNWTATHSPAALTRYRAQARTSPPTTSATTADVGVRVRVTRKVSDATPSRGERVRFSGRTAPAHDGAKVLIQRRTASGWRTVATTTLLDAGADVSRYAKRVKVRRTGTYRVRVPAPDADHLRGTSRRQSLKVG
jgi:hypothetical protein